MPLLFSLLTLLVVQADTVRIPSVPDSPASAQSGTSFLVATSNVSFSERQAAAVSEIVSGNIPDFLRTLAPVPFVAEDGTDAIIYVTRDYVAIGPDTDFVRMPLSLPSARHIATSFGMLLPTPAMVDAIFKAADIRVRPQPMIPGENMRSNAYYAEHNLIVEGQRGPGSRALLFAGHKKDIVATNRLIERPDRVAIYGWHRSESDPIQPLYLGHVDHYEDYSHGLRLVHPVAVVGGEPVPLESLVRTMMHRVSR